MSGSKVASFLHRNWVQLAIFVVAALALRGATFGELSRHADETFYFLVGQRMHDGILPYVGVWDRKPLGLFLIYYAISAFSTSVWAYQIVACCFAAATAMLVCMFVKPAAGTRAGILAGMAYLVILGPFEGATGQTPDFYNPLIAGAALLLFGERERLARSEVTWRIWLAMALCGVAMTIKQTVLFESVFFGLFVLACLWKAGTPRLRIARIAGLCCAIGALPTLSIAVVYLAAGHWYEFWNAMVLSNLAKVREGQGAWRMLSIAVKAAPMLLLAAWGLWPSSRDDRTRAFVAAWLVAALAGFLSVPNFYGHYALPVLVPLAVAAGLALGRTNWWVATAIFFAAYSLLWYDPLDSAWARETNRSMREMTRLIREHDRGGGLLVFDGPVYLYATAREPFLSPLVFPQHLNHQIENNVSHLDTRAEIDRIVAARPGVIVMSRYPRSFPVNGYSRGRILAYAHAHCRIVGVERMHQVPYQDEFVIFGDCPPAPRSPPRP